MNELTRNVSNLVTGTEQFEQRLPSHRGDDEDADADGDLFDHEDTDAYGDACNRRRYNFSIVAV